MQLPDDGLRRNTQKTYKARNLLLFTIPNPFDDCLRAKDGWYGEIKKMEETIKSVRERMRLIAERQKNSRKAIQAINEYCNALKRGKRIRPVNT